MSRKTGVLLISLAVAGAISAGLFGFDLALVGAIALAIAIVILVIQLAAKFLLQATGGSKRQFDDLVNAGSKQVDPPIEDPGSYNPKNPMVPFHWDPP
jgi:hypothetical protein